MKAFLSSWRGLVAPAATARAEVVAWDSWFTLGRFAFLLGLFIVAAFPDVILGSRSFFYRDFGLLSYPIAHYLRDSFWSGEIPLWNPLNNCGLPFVAQWNTMVFYPLSLLYVFLPLPWALNYFCLGHLFIAGLTMYALARRWTGSNAAGCVAGLAFALNGLTLHALMWTNNIAALAWMPLVILTVDRAWAEGRRTLLLAALISALQMLAGAPEIILFTWLIAGALWLGRFFSAVWSGQQPLAPAALGSSAAPRGDEVAPNDSGTLKSKRPSGPVLTVRLLSMVGWVSGLVAVQVWPFLDLLRHSQRSPDFGNGTWAMPGWGWANFIVPLFHCSVSRAGVYSQDDQQWTSSYYMGIGVLALAIVAALHIRERRVIFLSALALGSAIMALGENAFLFPALKAICPALGFGRFPVKFIVPATFALPLLAAYAIARIERKDFPRRVLGGVTVGLLALIGLLLWFARQYPAPNEEWNVTLRSGLSRALFLAAIVAVPLFWRRLTRSSSPLLPIAVLLALVGLDALSHAPRQNPTAPNSVYDETLQIPNVKPAAGGARAMVSPRFQKFLDYAGNPDPVEYCLGHRQALMANWNLLSGVAVVNGFYSLYTREQTQLGLLFYGRNTSAPEGLADFVGVSQISSDKEYFSWVRRPNSLPLVMIGQHPVFASEREVLTGLTNLHPRAVVYLEREAQAEVKVQGASLGEARATSVAAHRWVIDVQAAEPAVVTIAQTYYHHWRARVDGQPAKIWRANHGFQAVAVPSGQHQIELRYQDNIFRAGACVSALTLLVLVGGLRPIRRRSREVVA